LFDQLPGILAMGGERFVPQADIGISRNPFAFKYESILSISR